MEKTSLQRLGGIALILGVVFLTSWAVCWTAFLPAHERAGDVSVVISSPNWIWISSLAFPGIILMIFGFTAVYSKIFNTAGVVGFIGYFFIVLAYIFQAAKVTWEIFIYPVLVSYPPSIALIREKILFLHPLGGLYRILAETTIFIGILFFCLSLLRGKIFPKSAGYAILCGALIYAIGPMINIYLAIAGVVILSAGCFILGFRLYADAKVDKE
jgi:hypothetical protein